MSDEMIERRSWGPFLLRRPPYGVPGDVKSPWCGFYEPRLDCFQLSLRALIGLFNSSKQHAAGFSLKKITFDKRAAH